MRIVITGGAGFIGSNFVRHVLAEHPADEIVVLDKLTYAGNLENLRDVADDPRYSFVQGDICDPEVVDLVAAHADAIVNFAAETHVDRSISGPDDFIRTDVIGTHVLLEAARSHGVGRFLQVSTDEVYGDVLKGASLETDTLRPSSPYSASKAGGDLLVLAYRRTYDAPVVITRSSNNYGPFQYPEKIVPLFVTNALDGAPLPVYGDGRNVRDWIYVDDNCRALDLVLREGRDGEIYNVGGGNEVANVDLTRGILAELGLGEELIRYVTDRPGHDRRYALDCARMRALGWEPRVSFAEGLARTVAWYGEHREWWEKIKSGEWRRYYEGQYRGLTT
jgi:dTDP-glucose 4,6-dehydratase